MPSSIGIVYLVLVAAEVLIFSYAAYWGFSIRRALYVRVYRNQALGIGLVAVSFGIFSVGLAALIYIVPGHVNPSAAVAPLVALGILTVFYWIDVSMLVARRSDPLLRDTLHWTRLRVVFWAGNILGLGLPFAAIIFYVLVPLALGAPCSGFCSFSTPPPPPPPSAIPVFLAPYLLTGVAGLVFLLIAARRSKDINLQRSLGWFGLFAVSLLVRLISIVSQFVGPLANVEYASATIGAVGFIPGGYFLYKSAKALVPLNRISLD